MLISLLKPNGFDSFYIINGSLDTLLSLICYLIKVKKLEELLFLLEKIHVYCGAIIFKEIGP